MSLYYDKKLVSGVRDIPSMTLAQYNALTNKPKLWIRTDAPSGDRGINADDIEYSNGVSVKDKIDDNNTWKYVDHKTGTTAIDLPSVWNEVLVRVVYSNISLTTTHAYIYQDSSLRGTSFGSYGTSWAIGQISKTRVGLQRVEWAGQEVTSTVDIYVYYK